MYICFSNYAYIYICKTHQNTSNTSCSAWNQKFQSYLYLLDLSPLHRCPSFLFPWVTSISCPFQNGPFSHGSETHAHWFTGITWITMACFNSPFAPATLGFRCEVQRGSHQKFRQLVNSHCQKGSLCDRTQRRHGRRARCTHHPRDPRLARCRQCGCCWPRSAHSSSIPGPSRSLRSVQNGSWKLAHQSPGEQRQMKRHNDLKPKEALLIPSQRSRWQAKCRRWSQALQSIANLPPLSQIHGDWEDRWHLATIDSTLMIIAADRTGILPRLVRTPRHPLLNVHATNSTNFHVSRLFDLPTISKGAIRHDTPCTPRQCHKPPQKVQRATPAIGWWNKTTSESAPGACTGHQSQLRQQEPLATQVLGRHQRTCSLRSHPYPLLQTCHHQANLLRHTTPRRILQICRLRGSQKSRRGQTTIQQRRLVHAMSCGWLHQMCARWHSFMRLHTHLHRLVTSICARPPRVVSHVRHILGEHSFNVENWSPRKQDFTW